MLRSVMILMAVAAVCTLPMNSSAGDLDPPAGPFEKASAMYSLEDIYNRLTSGALGEKRDGDVAFKKPLYEPGNEPDDEPFHTLDDIMKVAPVPVEKNGEGALPSDVLVGKTFWGLRTDGEGWGLQTGTVTFKPGPNCNDGTLSPGLRWCDNGDGTVTDMITGLIWLKDAGCLDPMTWYEVIEASLTNILKDECGIDDNIEYGEWRLPTLSELYSLTQGNERVSDTEWQNFYNVSTYYWSLSTKTAETEEVGVVSFAIGFTTNSPKGSSHHVWPVRSQPIIVPMNEIP